MQDVYCPKCAEPCDIDYFHEHAAEADSTFQQVLRDFQVRGCEAVDMTHAKTDTTGRAATASAMYDLLGDDVDGAAAMFEDAGW